jgi:hypothetical protein
MPGAAHERESSSPKRTRTQQAREWIGTIAGLIGITVGILGYLDAHSSRSGAIRNELQEHINNATQMLNGNAGVIQYEGGATEIDLARPRLALNEINAALEIDPGNLLANLKKVDALALSDKSHKEALAYCLKIIRGVASTSSEAYVRLGYLYALFNQPDKAIISFQKAIDLGDRFPQPAIVAAMAHVGLGTVYYRRNNLAQASNEFEKATEADGANIIARLNLAALYCREHKVDNANAELARLYPNMSYECKYITQPAPVSSFNKAHTSVSAKRPNGQITPVQQTLAESVESTGGSQSPPQMAITTEMASESVVPHDDHSPSSELLTSPSQKANPPADLSHATLVLKGTNQPIPQDYPQFGVPKTGWGPPTDLFFATQR